MKDFIKIDEWKIIEEGFRPEYNRISESLFSIGNGRMGQRANFEEDFSGDSLQGSYVAGVYYPDKTRVGWWKNGYPEYFAKVLNAANWIGIHVEVEGEKLDLHTCQVSEFRRELNMQEGTLMRSFHAKLPNGKEISVESIRFCSIAQDEIGAISYSVTPLNFSGEIQLTPYVDGDVKNEDANYDEKFWVPVKDQAKTGMAWLIGETKKTEFQVATGMSFSFERNGNPETPAQIEVIQSPNKVGNRFSVTAKENETITLKKFGAILSSENYEKAELAGQCENRLNQAQNQGFDQLLGEHKAAWAEKWAEADIKIEGDPIAQQGIRFNIFQLSQTYTGEDARLNIGPKGFTGEKYGGSTYWDTEAYCLPFYLSTADQHVARNLLIYRYKHLRKAIENAEKLGFKNGAALYPMVTMNGEECHNEWEITFEEIHRNGAIAYAIFDYIRYTGDQKYLAEYGLEVLIGIARFWAQRVNWSADKDKYVMLGVTGPNEYENNINNNWYTNRIAVWCLDYARESLNWVKENHPDRHTEILKETSLDVENETEKWKDISDKMFYPTDEKRGVFLQQEGFLDKELIPVSELPKEEQPIWQNWSWDRILRSCYIKQADVLQGLFFLEDEFDQETHQRNFDFYEPLTVHESSLSPCVHVILAAKLGYQEKAYELYVRTSRLDLNDFNNDTEDGLHITSMAGTWMSVVKGFGGMRVRDGKLQFNPFLPGNWDGFSFKVRFRKSVIQVKVSKSGTTLSLESGEPLEVVLDGKVQTVS